MGAAPGARGDAAAGRRGRTWPARLAAEVADRAPRSALSAVRRCRLPPIGLRVPAADGHVTVSHAGVAVANLKASWFRPRLIAEVRRLGRSPADLLIGVTRDVAWGRRRGDAAMSSRTWAYWGHAVSAVQGPSRSRDARSAHGWRRLVLIGDERTSAGWAGDQGRFWARNQARQQAMLVRLSPRLIEAASIQPGEIVLDVGCGCGDTTLRAARAAGSGAVVGIDVSDAMLARARQMAATQAAHNVTFELDDAQAHQFTAHSFDVAISQLGVMFFSDPQKAFANIHRALRPDGRLAFLCWQAFDRNEHIALLIRVLATALGLPLTADDGEPGPFSLAKPDRIRGMLDTAGFAGIRIEPVEERLRLGANMEDVLAFYLARPEAREIIAKAPPELGEQVGAALRAGLEPHESREGVFLDSAAWLVRARA